MGLSDGEGGGGGFVAEFVQDKSGLRNKDGTGFVGGP